MVERFQLSVQVDRPSNFLGVVAAIGYPAFDDFLMIRHFKTNGNFGHFFVFNIKSNLLIDISVQLFFKERTEPQHSFDIGHRSDALVKRHDDRKIILVHDKRAHIGAAKYQITFYIIISSKVLRQRKTECGICRVSMVVRQLPGHADMGNIPRTYYCPRIVRVINDVVILILQNHIRNDVALYFYS